ncbi:MAG TPA: proton-conducting transporter membrane subunit [Kiritimatiellia bacterium]|nr:proton-conducting transporter membrane subunit [Kiritimatiellia bacterium]
MTSLLQQPEVWLVAVPVLAACVSFAMNGRARLAVVIPVIVFVSMAMALTTWKLSDSGAYIHQIGGWIAPLGISWRIDGLAVVMLLLTTLVGAGVSVYSLAYFGDSREERHRERYFWPLWFFLWGSLNAIFLSNDIFNWYVSLELSGLAAVALITLSNKPEALTGGMRYLILALSASLFYLLGVSLLYGQYGTLDLDGLANVIERQHLTMTAMAVMTIGMAIKAALFPVHFWLPPAHANAPSPVSAVLSALVVKGGFYIQLRLMTELWPIDMTVALSNGLGLLGGAAIIWGSYHAIRQSHLKPLIAYSTVAQLGYLFLMFPLMTIGWWADNDWSSRAWAGGIYQALSHGLAKASLFLSAGVLIHARGSDNLEGLRGLGERLPMTATAMALAGISLMGIPPGAGFIAKWLMLTVAMSSGQWLWAGIMIVGGLMAVGYLFRIFRRLMTTSDEGDYHRPSRIMEYAALYLAILSIAFGLSSLPVFELLKHGATSLLGTYLGVTP